MGRTHHTALLNLDRSWDVGREGSLAFFQFLEEQELGLIRAYYSARHSSIHFVCINDLISYRKWPYNKGPLIITISKMRRIIKLPSCLDTHCSIPRAQTFIHTVSHTFWTPVVSFMSQFHRLIIIRCFTWIWRKWSLLNTGMQAMSPEDMMAVNLSHRSLWDASSIR